MSAVKDPVQAHRKALADFLDRHHLKPHQLAKQAGFTPSTLYNFLSGNSSTLSTKTLEKIASSVGTTVDEILGGAVTKPTSVPVLFMIGVHGKMYPATEQSAPLPMGLDSNDKIVCAVARGDALHPLPTGLMIYFDQEPTPTKQLIGKLCVVRCSGMDEPVIRQIEAGSQPGLYNLIGFSTGMMKDVDIVAAHLVRSINQQ